MLRIGRRQWRIFSFAAVLTLMCVPAGAQTPALTTVSEVRYRGMGRAMARVSNPASIAAERRGMNDGVHAAVLHLKRPAARTSADCENAALALVTDDANPGTMGHYRTWSDFLPGGAPDLFPGDALDVDFVSRTAAFQGIVKEVSLTFEDLAGEHIIYEIQFESSPANDLGFEFESAKIAASVSNSQLETVLMNLNPIPNAQVGSTTLLTLTAASVTQVSSTTASLDAGTAPPAGGGFEVRWSDTNWGPGGDANLAGRFTTQTFTLPRLSKVQDYYLRQYDGSTPPKYSRFSAALHVDYPY